MILCYQERDPRGRDPLVRQQSCTVLPLGSGPHNQPGCPQHYWRPCQLPFFTSPLTQLQNPSLHLLRDLLSEPFSTVPRTAQKPLCSVSRCSGSAPYSDIPRMRSLFWQLRAKELPAPARPAPRYSPHLCWGQGLTQGQFASLRWCLRTVLCISCTTQLVQPSPPSWSLPCTLPLHSRDQG